VLWGSCAARADPLDDRFALSIGAFILSTNTTVRADGSAGAGLPVEVGTPIDVERQLGISDRTSFRLDGYWRFFERHKIRVMYFDESRSAQKNLTDEIVFRGQTYPVNTQVSTRFDTGVAELAYEYAFLRGEHYELAGSVGIHDLSFKLQLTAVGQTVNQQESARADVDGPLPVLGVHYVWEFHPRWSLDAMFQFFALKYQQYDGNLQDYNASVFYMGLLHAVEELRLWGRLERVQDQRQRRQQRVRRQPDLEIRRRAVILPGVLLRPGRRQRCGSRSS
jgi:hypothetical protein